MSDGFSDPSPAAPPNEGVVSEDFDIVPENASIIDLVGEEVDCTNCIHYRTCALIGGYRGAVEDWKAGDTDDEAPIKATKLAIICEEFELEEEDE